MERVGFVGLGIMGSPMARNAMKAGFAVTVTNRTLDRAKPLGEAGATVVRTPKEVAERSDLVVTMVTNSPDVEAVTFGPDGIAAGAHPGLLAIDMSTISPTASREMAKRAAIGRPPFHTLDAPVSGGEIGAIEARLAIMVGGDEPDTKRAMPLFEALGVDLDVQRDLRARVPTERVLDGWRHGLRRVLHGDGSMVIGYARCQQVFFYEIHEGDDDLEN